jgi:TetR/AcrR family transcriptional regulator, fatty acid metabolism regulator protein
MGPPVVPPRPLGAPRQRRAIATRQRLYEAAMAEYARVGVEAARVEDIVAAAGVSWGTFFHYFPTKDDVLLDAGAQVCRAYADALFQGLADGGPTEEVFHRGFQAMGAAARQVSASQPLRGAMLRQVINHPGRLTAFLGDETAAPVPATAAVMAEGQRRGEVRADQPAAALAIILLYSVVFSANRSASLGRPPGTAPLSLLALEIVMRGLRTAPLE